MIGYAVPFIPQLAQLLSMPEVRMCLSDMRNDTNIHMSEVIDGYNFVSDEFIQQNPDALVISMYTDDFEIVNPIGSHRKRHKITAFYRMLQNLLAKYKSKLNSI